MTTPWIAGPFAPVYNVRAFGAVGNGTTDDTVAIQAAIAAAPAGSTVVLPPGNYLTSGTGLSIVTDIVFCGTGNDSLLTYNGTGVALTINSNVGANGKTAIRDFALTTTGGSPTTGIRITNSTFVSVERICAFQFPVGFDLDSSYVCQLQHVQYDAKAIGDNTGPTANTKIGIRMSLCNSCVVDGQSLVFRTMYGVQLIGCSAVAIRDSDIEYSGTPATGGYGVKITSTAGTNSYGNQIANVWFEDCDSAVILDGSAASSGFGVIDTMVSGGVFNTISGTWYAIDLAWCDRTMVICPTAPVAGIANLRIGVDAVNTTVVGLPSSWVISGSGRALINLSDNLQIVADGSTGFIAQRLHNDSAASVTTKFIEEEFYGRDTSGTDKKAGALRYTPEGINWIDSTVTLYNRASDTVRTAVQIGSTGNTNFNSTGAPNNANGSNGDFYFRADGGTGMTIYQKRSGSWVGIV